jgi:hypothetical protein
MKKAWKNGLCELKPPEASGVLNNPHNSPYVFYGRQLWDSILKFVTNYVGCYPRVCTITDPQVSRWLTSLVDKGNINVSQNYYFFL